MLADTFPVAAAVLRERWRGLVLWVIAVAAVSAMYVAFWPAFGDAEEMLAFVDNLPEAMVTAMGYDRIGSAAGYLESTVFGLLAPILMLVFAITAGGRLIAGQEEDGTLELELAHPVARRRVVAERLAVLAASVLAITIAVAAVTTVMVLALDMDVAVSAVVATATGLALLTLGFGALALAVGAATGRRAVAIGTAAGLAVFTYIGDAVAPLVEWGGVLEVVSPFTWYLGADPLATGWDPTGLAALAAITLVAAGVALVAFDRRDLGV
jgi:ABC-2 type transport system permease protein